MNGHAENEEFARLIDALNAVAGVHPGHRAAHAKGIGATGTFTATGDAASLTVAAHLQAGVTVPVPGLVSPLAVRV